MGAVGVAPQTRFQQRIAREGVGVVAVLVPQGDLVDALPQQVGEGLTDGSALLTTSLRRLPGVVQAAGQLRGQPQPPIGLGQQHRAAVGADPSAVEPPDDLLARQESELKLRNTLCHRGDASEWRKRCASHTPIRRIPTFDFLPS